MKKLILMILLIVGFVFIKPMFGYSKSYYGFHLCDKAGFTCHSVKPSHSWEKLFPNSQNRLAIQKLNRSNLKITARPYIVVPDHVMGIQYNSLSPLPSMIHGHKEKVVLIDLSQQAFAAYDANGNQVRWGPISGGKSYCADVKRSCRTVTGSFRVYREGGPGCKSRKYDNAPMPYCMFFHGGFAMHGSWLPGHHASHGCVRMFIDDAKWLNKKFVQRGTKVIVKKGFQ